MVFAYRLHRQRSRQLARLFAPFAEKYGGEVQPATLLVLPQLRFEKDGRRYLISALATSGNTYGPFTFLNLELPFDTRQRFRIVRRDALSKGGARLLDAAMLPRRRITADEQFDSAFSLVRGNQDAASSLLAQPVRQRLLNSKLPRLQLRLDARTISVHMRGFATSEDDLRDLIEIAALLADRATPGPRG